MSASLIMDSTFRGPLAPGYCDILNLILNKRQNRLARYTFSAVKHSLPVQKPSGAERQGREHQVQGIGMGVAENMAHFVHHGRQQVGAICGGTAIAGSQRVRAEHIGKLQVVGRRRIDEPAVARAIVVDPDGVAQGFAQRARG